VVREESPSSSQFGSQARKARNLVPLECRK
jgi:hypothetical protein